MPSGLDQHHATHPEAVGNDAEACQKDRFGQWHMHLPAVGESPEEPMGLRLIAYSQR
jgi:hypothetical protein